jgi:plastocyanin
MRFLLPLALAAVLAAGCGSSDDGGSTTSSANSGAAPTATETAAGGASGSGVVEIAMKNIQFDPQSVTVKVGDTVKWTNEDDVEHDADANDGRFQSDVYGKGGTQEWKADKAGTVEYTCSVHPTMTGTITVK